MSGKTIVCIFEKIIGINCKATCGIISAKKNRLRDREVFRLGGIGMRIKRAASIPLILHDPYFSVWSSADCLYDADTVHWSGQRQQLKGYIVVDEAVYCFLGDKEFHKPILQKAVDVTATATEYLFENDKVSLTVRFTSPLLPEEPKLVSRPCTYVDFEVVKKAECSVEVHFYVSADLVQRNGDALVGGSYAKEPSMETGKSYSYAFMGRAFQQPLGHSGDNVTIDWGYAYLASDEEDVALVYDDRNRRIGCILPFGENAGKKGVIIAYDDMLSINYFGQWRRAYWTKEYKDILEAIGAAFADKDQVLSRAAALDGEIYRKAVETGGEAYAYLCCMSFRQAIAAHKLITDEEGNILFLSKENDSNGCIGTVDVSYPSVPLFFLYGTEYVKGMLRPVLRFASCEAWEYDFAPHDVGRYPYAWGQVYGLDCEQAKTGAVGVNGAVFPPYYMYPKGSHIYDVRYQMPVEECGNMLILMAAVCMLDGDIAFALPYMKLLEQWAKYLLFNGEDPGEQLCTDDFAGHLSHNANLSVKAIMGIEAFARLKRQQGMAEDADKYHETAKNMAANWEKRAEAGDHYVLAFGNPDTWSLKYNLVWDLIFGSGLFSGKVFETELSFYTQKANTYGVPLDGRKNYTKSDWILWCAAMSRDGLQKRQLIEPVAAYLEKSASRVPFSDWYETDTGEYCHFIARSVQGGIFMPMFMEKLLAWKKEEKSRLSKDSNI